jgi:hypothetical protein
VITVKKKGTAKSRWGPEWQRKMLHLLRILNEYQQGKELSAEDAALAGALDAKLTKTQHRYLRLYYGSMLTMEQIARVEGLRHISSVSRVLARAEDAVASALDKQR